MKRRYIAISHPSEQTIMGTGKTIEQAKEDAFLNAPDIELGSVFYVSTSLAKLIDSDGTSEELFDRVMLTGQDVG